MLCQSLIMEFDVKVYGGKKVANRSAILAFGSRSEPRRSGEATLIPKVDKALEKGSKTRAETACAVRRDTSLLMHRTCVDKTKDEMNPVTCKMRFITLTCRRIMRYYLGVYGRCRVMSGLFSVDP
jgi:hypothetical protein